MSRVWPFLLSFALLAGAARADGPERRQRPPPDYRGRVQMYETPRTFAPPKPADIPSDSSAIEPNAPAMPTAMRTPLTLIQPEIPGADGMRDRSQRDPLAELRGDPVSNKTSTGWGWLADGVASNLASRTARQTQDDSSTDAQNPDYANQMDAQTNQMSSTRDDRPSTAATNDSSTRAVISEPALGWVGEAQDNVKREQPETSLLPRPDTLDAARQDAAEAPSWASRESYVTWDSAPAFGADLGAAPSLLDLGSVVTAPREIARDIPEPPRDVAPDVRFGNGDRFKLDSAASPFTAGASASDFGSFTPFAMGPVEAPAIDIKPSSVSLPSTPVSSSGASTSLGGMGTESDRFVPKTLPW